MCSKIGKNQPSIYREGMENSLFLNSWKCKSYKEFPSVYGGGQNAEDSVYGANNFNNLYNSGYIETDPNNGEKLKNKNQQVHNMLVSPYRISYNF